MEMKFVYMMLVTWPRCRPCPYMVKKTSNIFTGTGALISKKLGMYSTVQAFFHQPAHPRGEGATIKRISPPRKPPAGGDCGGSAAFPRWVLQIKIDGQSLPVFKFSWSPPRVRGGIK